MVVNRLERWLRMLVVCLAAGAFLQSEAKATMVTRECNALGLQCLGGTLFLAADEPSVDKRVAGLEAYILNGDPSGSKVSGVAGPGHNAWLMTSSALVLFMTLPGLALFYGGLVRSRNVLSVLAQCLGIAGLVTILWWAVGYSLVFGTNFGTGPLGPFLGGTDFFFLKGVDAAPNTSYAFWVSQSVYCMFQLMFAIITPALILGAIAERMNYGALLLFIGLWMLCVYFPLAHMVWGATGLMNGVFNPAARIPAIDFAGGTVVHMSSGWSGLILCLLLGRRIGYGKEPILPHSMVLCMVGAAMLWIGWYGFNAGSAGAADGIAANAFTTTTLATAVASFVWGMLEYALKGKPSVLGYSTGAVAGLVCITPACGFVDSTGAVLIGVLAAVVPYWACSKLKKTLGYDDALDAFGVHGVGGTLGALLTGVFATAKVNGNLSNEAVAGKNGLAALVSHHTLYWAQLEAIAITIGLAVGMTVVLASLVRLFVTLRVPAEVETQGLDTAQHGEEGYAV
ncbi:ammonium transporter [Methylacidimicrobium tartarophylax]|uniref:Ammonium transporter n=1 Tax=Methylacidimicrobium tartarophylax TaxID=1041768 RepID=A0A5E6MIB1_9BACT|nr:ammonium transporter [Methylacidimicrobium tartarophylax]VVM05231.1 Ammonia channel [Methylacidimicrobium tartarophylax]